MMWSIFVAIALTAGGLSVSVASVVEAIPLSSLAAPQETVAATGEIGGNVVLAGDGQPLHGVRVLLIELGRSAVTAPSETQRTFPTLPPSLTYRGPPLFTSAS